MAGMNTTTNISISDLEVSADELDPATAAAIYQEHGALIVRGLMKPYLAEIQRDFDFFIEQARANIDAARPCAAGWQGPEGTLFIPAPESYGRDKQIMVLGMRYKSSSAFFRSAWDQRMLDVLEQIIGPDIELFMDGQCLVKEPVGGHPKNLHQDGAYFTHKMDGPTAILSYAVDTPIERGALRIVPGSHRLGLLDHIDTSSHLGLDPQDWPWERSIAIEGEAGDSIFFHINTIHGSQPNHTEQERPVFIHRYRHPHDYTVARGHSVSSLHSTEPDAESTRKQQEGYMVRGRRSLPQ